MHLDPLITFHGRKGPLLLVVADGVGLAPSGPGNALSLANTPVMDALIASRHSTRLHAHGTHVGLPTDDDMGNSEVGHNTLGGGRIYDQGAKLVNSALESGRIFESGPWQEIESRGKRGNTIHFLGLLSDGNVHSHIGHLFRLLQQCRDCGIQSVAIHALLDGRDVTPRSAPHYLGQLQARLDEINQSSGFEYRIASGGGRMVITMDRYEADWGMVERGFNAHVFGKVDGDGRIVDDAVSEVERQYAADPELSDQYLTPFVIANENGPAGPVKDGDAVVLFNFRGDRAIEISQALENPAFPHFDRGKFPEIYFCGMLQYDGDLNIPANYLVKPPVIERTMVEFLCAEKLHTFAVSETQKFGHVTYFWNGNRSGYLDESLETYIEIPSDNVPFDTAPEMKAAEITDATIALLESGKYRFGRINFANGDMVGHTGNIPATVKSLECIDQCMGRLVDAVTRENGILIFTADHGNADEMFVEKDGKRIKRTSHSLNPVPFVIVDSTDDESYQLNSLATGGGLANVAATVFNLLGYHAPGDYEPSLISVPQEPVRYTLYKGRVVNLGLETTHLPNQEMVTMEVVRHPGGAVIMAMDEEKNICVIRQFRFPMGCWIWELPAGLKDSHESPEEAARRELQEETGCTALHWKHMGSIITTPGFSDEQLSLYFASELEKGDAAPEPHERITVHWLPAKQITAMIRNGEMNDSKSIAAFHKATIMGLLD